MTKAASKTEISRRAVGSLSIYLVLSRNPKKYKELERAFDKKSAFTETDAARFDARFQEFFFDSKTRFGPESLWKRLYGDAPASVIKYFPRNACVAHALLIEMSRSWIDRKLLEEVGFVYFENDADIRRQIDKLRDNVVELMRFIGARYASGRVLQAVKALAYVQHMALYEYKSRRQALLKAGAELGVAPHDSQENEAFT